MRYAKVRVPRDVDLFLKSHGRTRQDVNSWVCHPRGPKELQALQDALGHSAHDPQCS